MTINSFAGLLKMNISVLVAENGFTLQILFIRRGVTLIKYRLTDLIAPYLFSCIDIDNSEDLIKNGATVMKFLCK